MDDILDGAQFLSLVDLEKLCKDFIKNLPPTQENCIKLFLKALQMKEEEDERGELLLESTLNFMIPHLEDILKSQDFLNLSFDMVGKPYL